MNVASTERISSCEREQVPNENQCIYSETRRTARPIIISCIYENGCIAPKKQTLTTFVMNSIQTIFFRLPTLAHLKIANSNAENAI